MDFKQEDLKSRFLGDKKIQKEMLFPTCTLVDNKIYAYTSFKRLPIVGDLHTLEVTLLEDVKDYDLSFYADSLLSVGDNIFVLELNGKRMLKYSIGENTCRYFDIGCHGKDWDNYAVFAQWDKYLYVVPRYIDGLIKFDIESGKIQKEQIIESKKNKKCKIDFSFFWCGCQSENLIWLLKRQGNVVVVYDMEQNAWREYELSILIDDCVHVMQYNEKLYILSSEGRIYCWDIAEEKMELFADCCEKVKRKDTFSRIAITDKEIFLFPSLGNDIFTIDLDMKHIKKYMSYPSDFRYYGRKEWSKYYGYCEDDDNYYFAMRSMNYILVLNKRQGKANWIRFQLPLYEDIIKAYMKYNSEIVCETECSIDDILNYVMDKSIKCLNRNGDMLAERIWKQVKKI